MKQLWRVVRVDHLNLTHFEIELGTFESDCRGESWTTWTPLKGKEFKTQQEAITFGISNYSQPVRTVVYG